MNDCEALMVLCSEVEDAGEDGVRLASSWRRVASSWV